MLRSAHRRPTTLLAVAGLLWIAPPRSDPVGVYAVIDRVVLAPDTANPTTVQIWGTFSLSEQRAGDNYRPAVKGYLYYAINPKNERASRAEWTDLQGMAGKKAIVGFGAKYEKATLGHVRCSTDAPSGPDLYPLGSIGVVKMGQTYNTAWINAKELLSASAATATCSKSK